MKKLIALIFPIVLLTGCSEWLNVNEDPNNPTDVDAKLVLPAAQVSIGTRIGGTLFNHGGFFAQYWTQAPEANQYNKVDNYDLNAPFLNRDYTELYAGALNDLEVIRKKAIEEEQDGLFLAATVLRAYTFQLWVDLIDQVPFSEALLGAENKAPKYDAGRDVYVALINELTDAITDFKAGVNTEIPTTDLILGGDEDEWLGFANTVLLKLYMRASGVIDYSSEISSLINSDEFITADVALDIFENQPYKHNPWYETNKVGLGTVNNIAALPIINYMSSKSDPRMAGLYVDVSGSFIGGVPAMKEDLTADYSEPIIGAIQPVYFITMSELELFKAEAFVRFLSNNASAQASYEAAIDYSLALHGLAIDGATMYGAGMPYEWNASATDLLEQIAMQKWVCLCLVNNIEAWTEIRRLGYPTLSTETAQGIYNDPTIYTTGQLISPNGNALGFGNLINRCPFPEESTRLNANAPEQVALSVPVWWDVN